MRLRLPIRAIHPQSDAVGRIAVNCERIGRSCVCEEALLGRPSARPAVAAVAQRYKPTAVRDERAKALVPPAQRTAIAMEIEKDWLFFAGWHVPNDHSLAVSGVEHRLFRFRQTNRPRDPPRMSRIIEDLSGDWRQLDERIEQLTQEIELLARGTERCRQLMTIPGIGPIIASAMIAAVGSGTAFAKGRDFAAWLGLVPKQMSRGDRTILGRISKRGNRYLRTMFMQGARVILLRPRNWAKHSFGSWLEAAAKRLHHNVLTTALANKLARIAWTVLTQDRNYEARVMAEAA